MLVVLAICNRAVSTTLVAVRTSNEVVLAADSKLGVLGDPGHAPQTVRKIFACGSFYIAWAGPVDKDTVIGFQPEELFRQTCTETGDAETKFKKFQELLKLNYTEYLMYIQLFFPAKYKEGVETEAFWGDLLMIGIENGIPFFRGLDIEPPLNEMARVVITPKPYSSGQAESRDN
jgi:hypothetical protein